MTIGIRLQRLLDKKGVSVSDLARRTGLSVPPIHNIINGKTKRPRIETLKRIAEFLETTIEYLKYGEDENAATQTAIKKTGHKPEIDQARFDYLYEKYIHSGKVIFRTNNIKDVDLYFILDLLEQRYGNTKDKNVPEQ